MAVEISCAKCGYENPPSAALCGLCSEILGKPAESSTVAPVVPEPAVPPPADGPPPASPETPAASVPAAAAVPAGTVPVSPPSGESAPGAEAPKPRFERIPITEFTKAPDAPPPPNPLTCVLASLAFPGAGHFVAGRAGHGALLAFGFLLSAIVVPKLVYRISEPGPSGAACVLLAWSFWSALCLYVAAAWDAAVSPMLADAITFSAGRRSARLAAALSAVSGGAGYLVLGEAARGIGGILLVGALLSVACAAPVPTLAIAAMAIAAAAAWDTRRVANSSGPARRAVTADEASNGRKAAIVAGLAASAAAVLVSLDIGWIAAVPGRPPQGARAGEVVSGTFRSAPAGVSLALPSPEAWSLEIGEESALVAARRPDKLQFRLEIVRRLPFRSDEAASVLARDATAGEFSEFMAILLSQLTPGGGGGLKRTLATVSEWESPSEGVLTRTDVAHYLVHGLLQNTERSVILRTAALPRRGRVYAFVLFEPKDTMTPERQLDTDALFASFRPD